MAALPWRRLRAGFLVAPQSVAARTIALQWGASFVPATGRYGDDCLAALARVAAVPVAPHVVLFVPADRVNEQVDVAPLVEALADGNADVAVAIPVGRGLPRTWLLSKLVAGIYQRDIGAITGLIAIRYAALTALGMSAAGDGWDVELMVRAMRLDLGVVQVPTPGILVRPPREGGLLGAAIGNARAATHGMYHILRHLTIK